MHHCARMRQTTMPATGQRCQAAHSVLPAMPMRPFPIYLRSPTGVGGDAMEKAKRRLFYSLRELGLIEVSAHPLPNSAPPLRFRFLEGTADEPVTTGHVDGLVTIDIAEAKDSERERRRNALGEDYRTPLGHLRHETGHYFWISLVDNVGGHDHFRVVFGDERQDYSEAMGRHY